MDNQAKQLRIELFEKLCRERRLPVTPQRRIILDRVLDLDNHPTADTVCDFISRQHPTISRTTVYRTLETLVRLGVITKACHPGSVVRYDGRIEVHHHLICMRCEEVIDISDEFLDAVRLPDTSKLGFEVTDHRVQLRGHCRRCRDLEEDS
ncbi:MAG: Fur family transcriptional regulator [Planctomycetota bacterium]